MRGQTARRWTGRATQVPGSPGLGSEAELRAAYTAHGAELYRFELRQLGDEGGAQDVVQEVFLRAWRRANSFDPAVASLRGWLFAIARNVVVDETRRVAVRPWRRTLTGETERAESAHSTDVPEQSVVDSWLVEEALRRIGPEHRVAIMQTYLRARPYSEVAAELGIPVGSLRSRVFYALKALRLAMDGMGVEL